MSADNRRISGYFMEMISLIPKACTFDGLQPEPEEMPAVALIKEILRAHQVEKDCFEQISYHRRELERAKQQMNRALDVQAELAKHLWEVIDMESLDALCKKAKQVIEQKGIK
jgi:hypothetical protein